VEGVLQLASLAEEGDSAAAEAIAISAQYLAKGVLILVNSLNPDIFVFTGGMSLLGDRLLVPIREHIRSSTFEGLSRSTHVCQARLGMLSGCYGAARLALSETLALSG
jgi:glucokinase